MPSYKTIIYFYNIIDIWTNYNIHLVSTFKVYDIVKIVKNCWTNKWTFYNKFRISDKIKKIRMGKYNK